MRLPTMRAASRAKSSRSIGRKFRSRRARRYLPGIERRTRRKVLENHRTALRNIRRDLKEAIEKLEKDKKIIEDEKKRALDDLKKVSHAEIEIPLPYDSD